MSHSHLIDTLSTLVRINSINPAYPNGRPETEMQRAVLGFFQEHGITTFEQEVMPGRANVVGRLAGRQPGKRIVFEAHSDTAGVECMTIPPFEPAVRDGRLYGRGSCDTKGGLAAMMHALMEVKRCGKVPPCEVWVVAAVDEEYSYRGVLRLQQNLAACAAVVSEPTEMKMALTSNGCLRWRINALGKAAHSSKPHLGVNAISHMAHLVLAVEEDSRRLKSTRHPLAGCPTLNIGMIHGGTQVNMVPDTCSIEIDRRLIPGEDRDEVLAHYAALVESVRRQNPEAEFVMEPPSVEDCALETLPDAGIALLTAELLRDMGLNAAPIGVPFGCDASKLARIGIPSIVLGPGSIDRAHAAEEYAEIDQVEQAMLVYRRIMMEFE